MKLWPIVLVLLSSSVDAQEPSGSINDQSSQLSLMTSLNSTQVPSKLLSRASSLADFNVSAASSGASNSTFNQPFSYSSLKSSTRIHSKSQISSLVASSSEGSGRVKLTSRRLSSNKNSSIIGSSSISSFSSGSLISTRVSSRAGESNSISASQSTISSQVNNSRNSKPNSALTTASSKKLSEIIFSSNRSLISSSSFPKSSGGAKISNISTSSNSLPAKSKSSGGRVSRGSETHSSSMIPKILDTSSRYNASVTDSLLSGLSSSFTSSLKMTTNMTAVRSGLSSGLNVTMQSSPGNSPNGLNISTEAVSTAFPTNQTTHSNFAKSTSSNSTFNSINNTMTSTGSNSRSSNTVSSVKSALNQTVFPSSQENSSSVFSSQRASTNLSTLDEGNSSGHVNVSIVGGSATPPSRSQKSRSSSEAISGLLLSSILRHNVSAVNSLVSSSNSSPNSNIAFSSLANSTKFSTRAEVYPSNRPTIVSANSSSVLTRNKQSSIDVNSTSKSTAVTTSGNRAAGNGTSLTGILHTSANGGNNNQSVNTGNAPNSSFMITSSNPNSDETAGQTAFLNVSRSLRSSGSRPIAINISTERTATTQFANSTVRLSTSSRFPVHSILSEKLSFNGTSNAILETSSAKKSSVRPASNVVSSFGNVSESRINPGSRLSTGPISSATNLSSLSMSEHSNSSLASPSSASISENFTRTHISSSRKASLNSTSILSGTSGSVKIPTQNSNSGFSNLTRSTLKTGFSTTRNSSLPNQLSDSSGVQSSAGTQLSGNRSSSSDVLSSFNKSFTITSLPRSASGAESSTYSGYSSKAVDISRAKYNSTRSILISASATSIAFSDIRTANSSTGSTLQFNSSSAGPTLVFSSSVNSTTGFSSSGNSSLFVLRSRNSKLSSFNSSAQSTQNNSSTDVSPAIPSSSRIFASSSDISPATAKATTNAMYTSSSRSNAPNGTTKFSSSRSSQSPRLNTTFSDGSISGNTSGSNGTIRASPTGAISSSPGSQESSKNSSSSIIRSTSPKNSTTTRSDGISSTTKDISGRNSTESGTSFTNTSFFVAGSKVTDSKLLPDSTKIDSNSSFSQIGIFSTSSNSSTLTTSLPKLSQGNSSIDAKTLSTAPFNTTSMRVIDSSSVISISSNGSIRGETTFGSTATEGLSSRLGASSSGNKTQRTLEKLSSGGLPKFSTINNSSFATTTNRDSFSATPTQIFTASQVKNSTESKFVSASSPVSSLSARILSTNHSGTSDSRLGGSGFSENGTITGSRNSSTSDKYSSGSIKSLSSRSAKGDQGQGATDSAGPLPIENSTNTKGSTKWFTITAGSHVTSRFVVVPTTSYSGEQLSTLTQIDPVTIGSETAELTFTATVPEGQQRESSNSDSAVENRSIPGKETGAGSGVQVGSSDNSKLRTSTLNSISSGNTMTGGNSSIGGFSSESSASPAHLGTASLNNSGVTSGKRNTYPQNSGRSSNSSMSFVESSKPSLANSGSEPSRSYTVVTVPCHHTTICSRSGYILSTLYPVPSSATGNESQCASETVITTISGGTTNTITTFVACGLSNTYSGFGNSLGNPRFNASTHSGITSGSPTPGVDNNITSTLASTNSQSGTTLSLNSRESSVTSQASSSTELSINRQTGTQSTITTTVTVPCTLPSCNLVKTEYTTICTFTFPVPTGSQCATATDIVSTVIISENSRIVSVPVTIPCRTTVTGTSESTGSYGSSDRAITSESLSGRKPIEPTSNEQATSKAPSISHNGPSLSGTYPNGNESNSSHPGRTETNGASVKDSSSFGQPFNSQSELPTSETRRGGSSATPSLSDLPNSTESSGSINSLSHNGPELTGSLSETSRININSRVSTPSVITTGTGSAPSQVGSRSTINTTVTVPCTRPTCNSVKTKYTTICTFTFPVPTGSQCATATDIVSTVIISENSRIVSVPVTIPCESYVSESISSTRAYDSSNLLTPSRYPSSMVPSEQSRGNAPSETIDTPSSNGLSNSRPTVGESYPSAFNSGTSSPSNSNTAGQSHSAVPPGSPLNSQGQSKSTNSLSGRSSGIITNGQFPSSPVPVSPGGQISIESTSEKSIGASIVVSSSVPFPTKTQENATNISILSTAPQSTVSTTVTVPCTQPSCGSTFIEYTTVCTFTFPVTTGNQCATVTDIVSTVIISENSKIISMPITLPCEQVTSGTSFATKSSGAPRGEPVSSEQTSIRALSKLYSTSELTTSEFTVSSVPSASESVPKSLTNGASQSGQPSSGQPNSGMDSPIKFNSGASSPGFTSMTAGSPPNGRGPNGVSENSISTVSGASGFLSEQKPAVSTEFSNGMASSNTRSSASNVPSIPTGPQSTILTTVTIPCSQSSCASTATVYTTVCTFTYPIPSDSQCAASTDLVSTVKISENSKVISIPVTVPCASSESVIPKSSSSYVQGTSLTGSRPPTESTLSDNILSSPGRVISATQQATPGTTGGKTNTTPSESAARSLTQSLPGESSKHDISYSPSFTVLTVPCEHTDVCSRSGYKLSTIYPVPSKASESSLCIVETEMVTISDKQTVTFTSSVLCSLTGNESPGLSGPESSKLQPTSSFEISTQTSGVNSRPIPSISEILSTGPSGSLMSTMITVQCTQSQCQQSIYSSPLTLNIPTATSSGQCMTSSTFITEVSILSATQTVTTVVTLPCGSSLAQPPTKLPERASSKPNGSNGLPSGASGQLTSAVLTGSGGLSGGFSGTTSASSGQNAPPSGALSNPLSDLLSNSPSATTTELSSKSPDKSNELSSTVASLTPSENSNSTPNSSSNTPSVQSVGSSRGSQGIPPAESTPIGSIQPNNRSSGTAVTTLITVPCTHTQCEQPAFSTPITINVPTPTSSGQCMTSTTYITEIVLSSATQSVTTVVTLPCGSSIIPPGTETMGAPSNGPTAPNSGLSVVSSKLLSSVLTASGPYSQGGSNTVSSPSGTLSAISSSIQSGKSSAAGPKESANESVPGSSAKTLVTEFCTHASCQSSKLSTSSIISTPTTTSKEQCMMPTSLTTEILVSSKTRTITTVMTLPCDSMSMPSNISVSASNSAGQSNKLLGSSTSDSYHTSNTGKPATSTPIESAAKASSLTQELSSEKMSVTSSNPSPHTTTPNISNGQVIITSFSHGSPSASYVTPGGVVTTTLSFTCTKEICEDTVYTTVCSFAVPPTTSPSQCISESTLISTIYVSGYSSAISIPMSIPCGSTMSTPTSENSSKAIQSNPTNSGGNNQSRPTSVVPNESQNGPSSETPYASPSIPKSKLSAETSSLSFSATSNLVPNGTSVITQSVPTADSESIGSTITGPPGTIATTLVTVPCTHSQCQQSIYSTPITIMIPTPTSVGQCMTSTTFTSEVVVSSATKTVTTVVTLPCGSPIISITSPILNSSAPMSYVPSEAHSGPTISPSSSPSESNAGTLSGSTSGAPSGPVVSSIPVPNETPSPSNESNTPGSGITSLVTVPCTHSQCQQPVYSTPVTINVPTPTSSGQCMTSTTFTTEVVVSSATQTISTVVTLPCGSSILPGTTRRVPSGEESQPASSQPTLNGSTGISMPSGSPGAPLSESPSGPPGGSTSLPNGSNTPGSAITSLVTIPCTHSQCQQPAYSTPVTINVPMPTSSGQCMTSTTFMTEVVVSSATQTMRTVLTVPCGSSILPGPKTVPSGPQSESPSESKGQPASSQSTPNGSTSILIPSRSPGAPLSESPNGSPGRGPHGSEVPGSSTPSLPNGSNTPGSAITSLVTIPCTRSQCQQPVYSTPVTINVPTPTSSGQCVTSTAFMTEVVVSSATQTMRTVLTIPCGSSISPGPKTVPSGPQSESPVRSQDQPASSQSTSNGSTGMFIPSGSSSAPLSESPSGPPGGSTSLPNGSNTPGSAITSLVTIPCTHSQCQQPAYSTPVTINVPMPTSSGQCMTSTTFMTEVVVSSATQTMRTVLTIPCGSSISPGTTAGGPSESTSDHLSKPTSLSQSSSTLSGTTRKNPSESPNGSGEASSAVPSGSMPSESLAQTSGSNTPGSAITSLVTIPCTHSQCQQPVYSTPVTINVPTPTSSGQCMTSTTFTTKVVVSSATKTMTTILDLPCGSSLSPGLPNNSQSQPIPNSSTPSKSPTESLSTGLPTGSESLHSSNSQNKPAGSPAPVVSQSSSFASTPTSLQVSATPNTSPGTPVSNQPTQGTSTPLETVHRTSGTVPLSGVVITVSTLVPTTTCPTSELTYMIEHGSSTLLEAPGSTETATAQAATMNTQLLSTINTAKQPTERSIAVSETPITSASQPATIQPIGPGSSPQGSSVPEQGSPSATPYGSGEIPPTLINHAKRCSPKMLMNFGVLLLLITIFY